MTWAWFHIVTGGIFSAAIIACIVVIMFRRLTGVQFTASILHAIAIIGFAVVAAMTVAFTFCVEMFDLTHPGVQFPIDLRLAYTYFSAAFSLLALWAWMEWDRKRKITDSEEQRDGWP
jgi:general stress protein CsbA